MSNLSKRTYKYYLLNGLKSYGYVFLIEMVLCVEWMLLGNDEDLSQYVPRMFVMIGGLFTVLMNGLYSMYGPAWYDSLILSMGARRKEIFWGQIIKHVVYILGNTIVLSIVAKIFLNELFMLYIYATALIAFVSGAVGLVIGHKMRRFGKIVIMIIAIGCGVIAGMLGVSATIHGNFNLLVNIGKLPAVFYPIFVLLVYTLLEAWVYKLNKTMMVR